MSINEARPSQDPYPSVDGSSNDSVSSGATEFFTGTPGRIPTPPLSKADIAREEIRQENAYEETVDVPTIAQIVEAKDSHEPPFSSNAHRFNGPAFKEIFLAKQKAQSGSNASGSRTRRPEGIHSNHSNIDGASIQPSLRDSMLHTPTETSTHLSRAHPPSQSETSDTMSKMWGGIKGAETDWGESRGRTSQTGVSEQGTGK
jgi:hypothetical protein